MTTPEIPKVSEIFAGLDAGAIDASASLDLAALVQQVAARNKAGTLTIKLTVEPQSMGAMAAVSADVTVKPPKKPKAGSILHISDAGGLHKTDPHQQTLDVDHA